MGRETGPIFMSYPTLVYKCPGPHAGPKGTTYAYRPVQDEQEHAAATAAGWQDSLPPAVEAFLSPIIAATSPTAGNTAPTRAELLQKAEELGIKIDGRLGDAKIAALITATLMTAALAA